MEGETPRIDVVTHQEYESANVQTFPYDDALEQMYRFFICADKAGSSIEILEIDVNSVLTKYRDVGCPCYQVGGKQVIDLTDSLASSGKLDDRLQMISHKQLEVLIDRRQSELAQIGIGQSQTLNRVYQYVADQSLQSRIGVLKDRLASLKNSTPGPFGKLGEIAVVVGEVYSGYSGAGALLGGIERIKELYSKMPSELSEAKEYYKKNRDEFSLAANVTANGVDKIKRAIGAFNGLIPSASSSAEIAKIQREVRALEAQRKQLFREVADRADKLEKQWTMVANNLFLARERIRSIEKNVATILEDVVANKFVHSLQVGSGFFSEFGGCVTSWRANSFDPRTYDSTTIGISCGDTDEALGYVTRCLVENKGPIGSDLVVRSKTKIFRIGKNTEAAECYSNWLWRTQREIPTRYGIARDGEVDGPYNWSEETELQLDVWQTTVVDARRNDSAKRCSL